MAGAPPLPAAVIIAKSREAAARRAYVARMHPDLERAMLRWSQLYYCERDDGIFVPGSSTLVPLQHMIGYLYQAAMGYAGTVPPAGMAVPNL